MILILIGPPFSGKSRCGSELAKKLRWEFIDTDTLIENEYTKDHGQDLSCRQIVQAKGEFHFREREKATVHLLSGIEKNTVISTGGGSIMDPLSAQTLTSLGKMIFLDTDIGTLWNRINTQEELPTYLNPNNPKKSLELILEERTPTYLFHADQVITTNNESSTIIIKEIIDAL
jgi:shikimate kinase